MNRLFPRAIGVLALGALAGLGVVVSCVHRIEAEIQPPSGEAARASRGAIDAPREPGIWPRRIAREDHPFRGAIVPLGTQLRMVRIGNDIEWERFQGRATLGPDGELQIIGISEDRTSLEARTVGALEAIEDQDLVSYEVEIEHLGDRDVVREVYPHRLERRGSMWAREAGPLPAGVESFVFVSGAIDTDEEGGAFVRVERTWYQLVEPRTPEVRGVVLLIPGMFGTPEPVVERLVRALTQRGYAVVRFLAHSARFTEEITFEIDPADLSEAAERIARVLGDRAAENAYAASAAIRDAMERRPNWRGKPVGAIGFSGGAMVLPTVLAYDPDLYNAAIYVAGGAHFWRVAQESNYRLWVDSVRFRWLGTGGGAPAAGLKDELDRLYLEAAPLDSARTAAVARRVPALMIHGASDQAVPAALGDLLWEKLGQPERRVYPVGHEVLFVTLPAQFPGILDWLDATLHPAPRRSDH